MNRIDVSMERLSGRRAFEVFPLVATAFAVALTALAPRPAGATTCVISPREGALPVQLEGWSRELAAGRPADPGGFERLEAQVRANRDAVREGLMTAAEADARGGLAVAGTRRIPILPVLYANSGDDPINPDALEIQLFAPWLGTTMRSYYLENSYGDLNVDGDVYGYERVAIQDFYYEGVDNGRSGGGATLVAEAVALFDPYVDFRLYDNDGPDNVPSSADDDGMVDIAFVLHPEIGGECGGAGATNIWSHHAYLSDLELQVVTNDVGPHGPVVVDRYCLAPSLNCGGGMIEIGVFCHEFGHALGLPDLYDTDGGSQGIGFWGLMGAGNWNSPQSPAHMSAFEKERLGWLNYVNVTADQNLCLPPLETSPVAARLWSNGAESPQYFLVENRQPIGFDSQLAGNGLVIYHVDEAYYDILLPYNGVNAAEAHKAIDVECADATTAQHVMDADDLDIDTGGGNRGDAGDVWCEDGVQRTFFPFSIPDSRTYGDDVTGVWVRNVGPCDGDGGIVCAEYRVGVQAPVNLCVNDCVNDDCNQIALCDTWWGSPDIWVDNDGNGTSDLPAPGIENKVWFRVKNLGPDDASGVEAALHITPGAMGIEWPDDASYTVGTKTIPLVAAGEEYTDYFVFEYPELFDFVGHYCMGLVIDHPNDPVSSQSASLSNNIAQINHQVLVQRAGGSAKGDVCSGAFARRSMIYLYDGAEDPTGLTQVEVRVGSPPDFNDAVIPPGWSLAVHPRFGPFALAPGGRDSITVRMSSANASDGQMAHVPLTLWNLVTNAPIDGVVLDFRIDCAAPGVPFSVDAEWIQPPGDSWGAPTARVQWAPVVLDVNGASEVVEHYEVWRESSAGGFAVLLGEVAIDAEPDAPLFQWFDPAVTEADCPITYRYFVRAVDAADNAGGFAAPIELACVTTSVEHETPTFDGVRASPNPFGAETTIRFSLPAEAAVDVAIFDVAGKRVRGLVSGTVAAGDHAVAWNGADDAGRALPSGIYFYRLFGRGLSETRRFVLAR